MRSRVDHVVESMTLRSGLDGGLVNLSRKSGKFCLHHSCRQFEPMGWAKVLLKCEKGFSILGLDPQQYLVLQYCEIDLLVDLDALCDEDEGDLIPRSSLTRFLKNLSLTFSSLAIFLSHLDWFRLTFSRILFKHSLVPTDFGCPLLGPSDLFAVFKYRLMVL